MNTTTGERTARLHFIRKKKISSYITQLVLIINICYNGRSAALNASVHNYQIMITPDAFDYIFIVLYCKFLYAPKTAHQCSNQWLV